MMRMWGERSCDLKMTSFTSIHKLVQSFLLHVGCTYWLLSKEQSSAEAMVVTSKFRLQKGCVFHFGYFTLPLFCLITGRKLVAMLWVAVYMGVCGEELRGFCIQHLWRTEALSPLSVRDCPTNSRVSLEGDLHLVEHLHETEVPVNTLLCLTRPWARDNQLRRA